MVDYSHLAHSEPQKHKYVGSLNGPGPCGCEQVGVYVCECVTAWASVAMPQAVGGTEGNLQVCLRGHFEARVCDLGKHRAWAPGRGAHLCVNGHV